MRRVHDKVGKRDRGLMELSIQEIALLVGHPCRLERLRDARLKDTNGQTRVPHCHMTGTICMYRLN